MKAHGEHISPGPTVRTAMLAYLGDNWMMHPWEDVKEFNVIYVKAFAEAL